MFWGNLKKDAQGFSFVELAVVLASITAIIAMVSGGLVMINKSKTKNITADISNFTNAINQFEKTYYALPGDIANLKALPDAIGTEGNGNGAIDTDEEAINVWYHLSMTGLIDGNYDGTSKFKPGIGVPAASIEGGGYNIKLPEDVTANNMPSQAIIIELAGFSDTDNSLAILTAEDAKALDEKSDNGFPLTGTIIAEGLGSQCVNTYSKYNLSNDRASCRVLFVVRSGRGQHDAPQVTGYCNELGQTRRVSDFTQDCPKGYVGKVVETCRIDSNNVGAWEITDRICEEVECSSGGKYRDTRRLSCINGMKGTEGIVEQCTENGIWKVIRTDCKHRTDLTCKTDGEIRKAQACDWGKAGYAMQTCTNHKWSTPPPNTCKNIVCGTDNIGATNITNTCGANYQGDAVEVCTIAGSWETTSVGSTCSPDYDASSCIAGSTPNKDIGCPPGTEGEHILTCVDAATDYWTTHRDTCKPIKCSGDENIGSVRVKDGAFCPNGTNGTVMEYCRVNPVTGDPEWKEVLTNCVVGICETPSDNMGNAYWPTTVGGTTATYTKCVSGYQKNPLSLNNPTRFCNSNGTWSNTVNDECVRKTCPATTLPDGTTYPSTIAGESKIQGSCDTASGYFAPAGILLWIAI